MRIPDEDAPVLLKVTTTVTKVNDAADPVRVSGTVTLQFSETIYHINDSGNPDTLRAIIQRDVDKQKEVGFLNLVNQSQSNLKYSKESGNTTNTITLDFWDAPGGGHVQLLQHGPSGGRIRQQPPERQLYAGAAADRGDRADHRRDHLSLCGDTGQLSGKLKEKADMGGQSIARPWLKIREGS